MNTIIICSWARVAPFWVNPISKKSISTHYIHSRSVIEIGVSCASKMTDMRKRHYVPKELLVTSILAPDVPQSRYMSENRAQLQPGGPGSLIKKNIKYYMWEHTRNFHRGVVGVVDGDYDYKVELTGTFNKCLNHELWLEFNELIKL